MTIRITPIRRIFDVYGIVMPVGVVATVDDDFGLTQIANGNASDTDGAAGSNLTGTVRMLRNSDNNTEILSANAAAVAVTIPKGLSHPFSLTWVQTGAGQCTFTGATGVTINNISSQSKTSGQHAMVSLVSRSTDNYDLVGSTGA